MSGSAATSPARWALWLVLAGGYVLMLRLNLPGHLSVDSVLALHEGRFGVRTTWNPAIFGWLLGVLDRITPGTALVVALSGGLLFGGWLLLSLSRARTTWLAPILALGLIALPQVAIYPAIVWKDVLFADCAIAGFALLAFGVRKGGTPWISLGLAALLLAAAGLLRQNGLILAPPAALAIAWALSARGWKKSLGLAAGWLAAVAALTLVLSAVARPQGAGAPDNAGEKGLRLLATYDLAAAAHLQPGRLTPRIDAVAPDVGQYLRANADRLYAPERVDVLTADKWLASGLKRVPRDVILAEWRDLLTSNPGLWLQARTLAFRQVAATPVIDRCLPVTVGVEGPPATLEALRIPPRRSAADMRLYNWTTWFLDTPAMSHVAYAAAAFAVMLLMLLRREPPDLIVAGLMAGALGFAASFFAISIACDYRYLYVLDVAALTGLLYVALDPSPGARRRARR
ncbi:MAG: hemophore-related protein [Phenylobacterium sp.]|uniref:hemophore-related protein n=1 Tax=Phenylobacterium sp. TaxID=1871053 RepID=UPI001A5392A6|nr:hemophore-related protein [Phenylobacterium sp.]MBL8554822.1 hemophore-related protein [Phenylobacterium sp.]